MADGPDNYEATGVYVGPLPNLKGKTAQLVVYKASGRVMAAFDDPSTGYVGLSDFGADAFEITPKGAK